MKRRDILSGPRRNATTAMNTLSGPAFTALLARADVAQAAFARLAGVTARQVNNWCRNRAAVPRWAALLAIALAEISPDELEIRLAEVQSALKGMPAPVSLEQGHEAPGAGLPHRHQK
jgi:DNA-binding transcriptional regulator YiaG